MTATNGRVRLGFLYPGYAAEDDYPRMARALGDELVVKVVHTSVGEDAHRVDALLDLGGNERLIEGAGELKEWGVDAALWACTSGSFVFGWEGARAQAQAISDYLGVPVSSTSLAFVEALRSLAITRVAVAATYPDDVAQEFADYLAAGGIEVLSVGSEDIITAAEVGTFGRDRIFSFVRAGDHPEAQAVLVPDTALHTVEWLNELEDALGKPVLTANQVSMWEALRLARRPLRADSLGALFARSAG